MNYVEMAIAGIFGIILHSLLKIKGINNRLQTENYWSVFREFWKTDWPGLCLSFCVVFCCVFLSSEWIDLTSDTEKPLPGDIASILQYKISGFIKTTFVIVGFCANSVVLTFLKGTEQKLIRRAQDAGVSAEEIITPKPKS